MSEKSEKGFVKTFLCEKKIPTYISDNKGETRAEGAAWLLPDKLISSMIAGWKSASTAKFNGIKELGVFPVD